MKLNKLLKNIAPLPWHGTVMPDTGEPATAVLSATGIRVATLDVRQPPAAALANRAYLIHAANVLPDLVRGIQQAIEAFYNVPEVGGRYDQQHSDTHLAAAVELKELLARAENVSRGSLSQTRAKASGIQLARTAGQTIHGHPGEPRVLPANLLVFIEPASNLPPHSRIKYWAQPVEGHPWPAETAAWATDVGVGLAAEDVVLIAKRPHPVSLK